MRNRYFAAAVLLCIVCVPAFADDQIAGLMTQFETATKAVNAALIKPAIKTAVAALTLQWIAVHYKEIFSNNGDFSSLFAKIVACVSWFGFSVYLLNHKDLFSDAFNAYLKLATEVGSAGAGEAISLEPGKVLWDGIGVLLKTNWAITKASATGSTSEVSGTLGEISKLLQNLNPFGHLAVALEMLFADVFMFVCYIVLAASLFMARVEFWLMFAVTPLAVALIPLQAFRDQGLSPIKGVISLGLRIIILGLISGVTNAYSKNLIALLDKGLPANEYLLVPVWCFMGGLCICAIVAGYAGKIASSIASGSASFSGADVIGGAGKIAATAAVGTAAVAAVKAGGSAALGAGKSLLQQGTSAVSSMTGGKGAAGNTASAVGDSAKKALEGFGKSAIESRPPNNATESAGSSGSSPAGIGGTSQRPSATAQAVDKLTNNAHKAGQSDGAATEIKINLSGD